MDKLIAAVALMVLCQGCATPPSRYAAAIKEVDARQVANCTLISTVVGKCLIGGGSSIAAENAVVDAKEQASGLGATHVVIQSVDGGSMVAPATATAKAYRCN